MAKELYEKKLNELDNGVYLDCSPLNQPKGTRRFTLNAVEGADGKISNEKRNVATTSLPNGYFILGDRYTEADTSFVILTNPITGATDIGLLDRNDNYTSLVNTKVLPLIPTL